MYDLVHSKLKRLQSKLETFFDLESVASLEESQLTTSRKFAHFWLLVWRSFVRNRCPLRASALAYTTLLAIIPLLAIAVGVSSSMLKTSIEKEGEQPIAKLIDKLVAYVAPQLDLVDRSAAAERSTPRHEVVSKINQYIATINSGALNVTGVIALIIVAIGLLKTIEATFNDIWGVSRGRSVIASLVRYWAALTLWPLILVVAFVIMSGGKFQATQQWIQNVPFLSTLIFYLLSWAVLTAAFALFYGLMPNTVVDWRAALVGGFVGATLWQVNNFFSIVYVSRVVTYSKIYGGLGLVLIFLMGLYFSWLIVLFGAQVAYAFQNRRVYLQEKRAENINQRARELIALRIVTFAARRFLSGTVPPTAQEISDQLGLPTRLICKIVGLLLDGHILLEVSGKEPGYVPARPLPEITAGDIITALRAYPGFEMKTRTEPGREVVSAEFERIERAGMSVAREVTLQTLAQRADDHHAPPDHPPSPRKNPLVTSRES